MRRAYTIPAIFLIETSSWNDKGNSLELAILLLHGKSQDSRRIVQGLDERRVVAIRREDDDLKIQVRLGDRTVMSGRDKSTYISL